MASQLAMVSALQLGVPVLITDPSRIKVDGALAWIAAHLEKLGRLVHGTVDKREYMDCDGDGPRPGPSVTHGGLHFFNPLAVLTLVKRILTRLFCGLAEKVVSGPADIDLCILPGANYPHHRGVLPSRTISNMHHAVLQPPPIRMREHA